ncbi:MAG: glycogen debranching protein [Clostridiales bacterium]|nr:glycogen debranching protein [Clostridiales bacterium]
MEFDKYVATGGQTSRPFGQFNVPYPKWEKLSLPTQELPEIDLNPRFKEMGWAFQYEGRHFIPGVTAEEFDWFWSNMEKGYYLWAPGSHKRFQWIKEPWQYGHTNSKHTCVENMHDGALVDPDVAAGDGYGMLLYNRYDMDVYPFNIIVDGEGEEHVIIEGTETEDGHNWMLNCHMWKNVEGGIIHRTAGCTETLEDGRKVIPPDEFPVPRGKYNIIDHCEYEMANLPKFLPGLYKVWKDHPDPSQNVMFDLTVKKTGDYTWSYVTDNSKPIDLEHYFD